MSDTGDSQSFGTILDETTSLHGPPSVERPAAVHDAPADDGRPPVIRLPPPVPRRARAASDLRRVGHALRTVGEELRKRDRTQVANYASGFADGLDRLAAYVEPKKKRASPLRGPAALVQRARFVGLVAAGMLKRARRSALGN